MMRERRGCWQVKRKAINSEADLEQKIEKRFGRGVTASPDRFSVQVMTVG